MAHNLAERQDDDKTESRGETSKPKKRVRVRAGEGTVAYWRDKLFRNTYRDRDGRTVEVPEYYVRMRYKGETRRVRLNSSDKDRAAEHALTLHQNLQAEGWSVVDEGKARLPSSMTPEKFCEVFRTVAESMEKPPRPVSIDLYTRHFKRVCALAGVTQVRQLTPEAIEVARDRYRAEARKAGVKDPSNSLGIILGNAAACFSREARAIFARKGLKLENPFSGIRRSQRIQPVTPLPREVMDRFWAELPKLRDGDPQAAAPDAARHAKEYAKAHQGRKPRWVPVDWRRPHRDVYAAILLGIGLGLRANEIDKARWSWFQFDPDGNCFIDVHEEEGFKPKGGAKRLISVPKELYDELVKTRTDLSSPFVLGGGESDAIRKKGYGYRRGDVFRKASRWLRDHGIETASSRGKPLHRLRKQFGSEVATKFGLFICQKLLGHSSPVVTSKFYAAATELPKLTHLRIA